MRKFEGTLRIRLDAEHGRVFLDRGNSTSKLTANDAEEIAVMAAEAAIANKAKLDRWGFYLKGQSEKLPKDTKALLEPKLVLSALKSGYKPVIVVARYGKPSCWLMPDSPTKTAKPQRYTDLA